VSHRFTAGKRGAILLLIPLTIPESRLACYMAETTPSTRASFSIPSIISLIAAIWSFTSGAIFGLILAIVAIVFGAIGILMSLSPAKRGGVVSTLGVGAGAIGVIAAVVKAIMWMLG